MRAKRTARVLVALLALSLLPALAVSANHGPTVEDVVSAAGTVDPALMCTASGGQQVCTASQRVPNHRAVVTPDSGPLKSLVTVVNATVNHGYYMFSKDVAWNIALHEVGCNDPNAVGSFVATLGEDTFPGAAAPFTIGPKIVGECSMTGSLVEPPPTTEGLPWYYTITSTTLAGAFPTATPTATPKPTVKPTVRPTATATATATAIASESASASAAATATATANETPEQTVAGITFTPEPSSALPAPAGGGGDWAGSVPSASEISTKGADLAGSALAALLLLLAMGFIGELFNNTFTANYDRILAGWQKSWLGKASKAFSGLWGGGK